MNSTKTMLHVMVLLLILASLTGCRIGELSIGVESNPVIPTTTPIGSNAETPEPTIPPAIPPTFTPIPPSTPTPLAGGSTACTNLAEFVQDLSVQDRQEFHPGVTFLKSWRLRNVGSCTWTQTYAYVHTGGNNLAAYQDQALPSTVRPGETTDLTVAMTAPDLPGLYLSEWMLQDDVGQLFGVGPQGTAPFSARINVVPVSADVKATPYADSPAAGICAEFEGEVVTMTVSPGMPDPRCVIVKPDQRLHVVNNLETEVTAALGNLTTYIAPGGDHTFEKTFGEFLMPGVHNLNATPCCGGSIWLQEP